MMTSDAWPHPLTNVGRRHTRTNYGHIHGDFSRACHVTLYTDFVRGYATFDTLVNYKLLVPHFGSLIGCFGDTVSWLPPNIAEVGIIHIKLL